MDSNKCPDCLITIDANGKCGCSGKDDRLFQKRYANEEEK